MYSILTAEQLICFSWCFKIQFLISRFAVGSTKCNERSFFSVDLNNGNILGFPDKPPSRHGWILHLLVHNNPTATCALSRSTEQLWRIYVEGTKKLATDSGLYPGERQSGSKREKRERKTIERKTVHKSLTTNVHVTCVGGAELGKSGAREGG